MRFTDMVQTVIRRLGYDIVRLPHHVSNPIDLLDVLVRDALSREPKFFFVQVGANDGVRADPLRASILKHRLNGLLIEPLPDLFAKLQQNYAGAPGLSFENCAVAATSGHLPMFRVRQDAPVPDDAHGLASFNRANLTAGKQGIPNLDAYVVETAVVAQTLPEILSRHGNPNISLLVVDTEGYDGEIVTMALEAGLRPPIIVYEHVHLPIAAQAETLRRLKNESYRFQEIGMDTYALRDIT